MFVVSSYLRKFILLLRLSGSSLSLSYATYQNTNEFKPGPPIVITHGLMGNKGNWNSLSKVISSKGRQVRYYNNNSLYLKNKKTSINYHISLSLEL